MVSPTVVFPRGDAVTIASGAVKATVTDALGVEGGTGVRTQADEDHPVRSGGANGGRQRPWRVW